jgi:hypothetical protein
MPSILNDKPRVMFIRKLDRLTHIIPVLSSNQTDRHNALVKSRVLRRVNVTIQAFPDRFLHGASLVRAPERVTPVGFCILEGGVVTAGIVTWPCWRMRRKDISTDGRVERGPSIKRMPRLLISSTMFSSYCITKHNRSNKESPNVHGRCI